MRHGENRKARELWKCRDEALGGLGVIADNLIHIGAVLAKG
jgi:hypothetical protein